MLKIVYIDTEKTLDDEVAIEFIIPDDPWELLKIAHEQAFELHVKKQMLAPQRMLKYPPLSDDTDAGLLHIRRKHGTQISKLRSVRR